MPIDSTACGQADILFEVASPQRTASGAGEDQRARVVFGEDGQVLAERRDDHLGDADDPAACPGLRPPDEHFAGRPLDVGGPDSASLFRS